MHYPNPRPVADESAGTSLHRIKLRDVYVRKTGRRAEMDYQLIHQLRERAAMARGADAGTAYGRGSDMQMAARRRDAEIVARKEERQAPVTLGTRERGTQRR
jgi:hypothetical protein